MPVNIVKKEFVMPKRDWHKMSENERCDFLIAKGFNLGVKLNIIESSNDDTWGYKDIIKIQQDFKAFDEDEIAEPDIADDWISYASKLEKKIVNDLMKPEIKGLQVIKFEK